MERGLFFGFAVRVFVVSWVDNEIQFSQLSFCSQTGFRWSVQRVNDLELALLTALDYQLKVLGSEYAKYYFLLRSMLIKSGLGAEDTVTTPLDVAGARRLQHVSRLYQSTRIGGALPKPASVRSKSTGAVAFATIGNQSMPEVTVGKVGLEYIVEMS